jgi:plasmid stabilization system protein ParE
MRYTVIITPSAKADIFEINAWLLENHPNYANAWLWGISQAITSLSEFPERCPLASESDAFDAPVRQLLYGKKPHVYRILFMIEEHRVFVLRVRHTRQQRLWEAIEN